MMRSLFLCVLLGLGISGTVFAQVDGNPENWCRPGVFTVDAEAFSVGTAKGAKNTRIYFYNDDESDCPGNERCRSKAYLLPGDQVLVSRSRGNFSCVWYTPVKGSATVGWVRTDSFRFIEASANPALSAWLGEWKYGENTINFTHNKLSGWLNVTGDAYWKGVGDNIHIGELDGRVEPENGKTEYSDGDDEYDCKATMRLVGSFLVVKDNNRCGGANVTFSGVYRRKTSK